MVMGQGGPGLLWEEMSQGRLGPMWGQTITRSMNRVVRNMRLSGIALEGDGNSKASGTGKGIHVDLSEENRLAGAKGSHRGMKGESGRQTVEGSERLLTFVEGRKP